MHKALREALVNAIVHADYSERLSVLVVKPPGYFGFRNPGRMRIPNEASFEGGISDCRNRSLQRMFSLIGLGEQALETALPEIASPVRSSRKNNPETTRKVIPEL